MRNILVIAYYYPPIAGAGVQRILKFTKYLPENGIRPIVLTVKSCFVRWPKDITLINDIPREAKVYRTLTFDWQWIYKLLWGLKLNRLVDFLNHEILIPDPEISWLPFAKLMLKKIIRKHDIKLVYITGGPFSSMLLGVYLKNRYALDYVLDFRDEWTNSPSRIDNLISLRTRTKESLLESNVLIGAKAISFINKYMADNYICKYDFMLNKRYAIIPNGYDAAEFEGVKKISLNNSKQLQILYTGSFYGRRKPELIWQALDELVLEKKLDRQKIWFKLYGKNTPNFVLGRYHNNPVVRELVTFKPYINHRAMLQLIVNSHVLLLFVAPGLNAKAELTGKIYEYIRSYTPILAIVPMDGAAAEVIKNSRSGFVYDSNNVCEIKKGLLHVYKLWEQGNLEINPDLAFISQFSRQYLTHELSQLFNEILDDI